jgi:hypothetical protein
VRHVIVSAIALAALAADARADDGDGIVGFRRWTVGVAILGHASHVNGAGGGGWGPGVELALGARRVQYFLEGGALFEDGNDASSPVMQASRELRGGVGVRWLARQFPLDRAGAIEMHLEAIAGVERYRWDSGAIVTRPDIAFGWAWQVRLFRHRFAFHETARVVFSPSDTLDPRAATSCRGCAAATTSASSVPSAALLAVFGVSI